MTIPKAIAFYLPQFHPIPENDNWWGTGFTEWRNVVQARPLFPGHYQPHIPSDLGFYDLRLPEVRLQQSELARRYGIDGFCFYHYWFSGKQLLERPVTEIFESGEPDFPFCLCWANENWTRRWDGHDKEILIAQDYSLEDDMAHILTLIPYFRDPRYLRIDNKPLFLVYRSSLLPDPLQTTSLWRRVARENGIDDLYLVKVESFPSERKRDPRLDGFDAALDFQPDWGSLPKPILPIRAWHMLCRLIDKYDIGGRMRPLPNRIMTYKSVVRAMLSRPHVPYPRIPCVTPSWDNSSRRRGGGAVVLHSSTPQLYGAWLASVLSDTLTMQRLPEPLVFINGWNEWAEGNHLEPDLRWNHAYLEQTLQALSLSRRGDDVIKLSADQA